MNDNKMKPSGAFEEIREWVQSIVVAVMIAFIIKFFFLDFVLVNGASMNPTLLDGDRLIINKIEYRLGNPEYGDIITINHSDGIEYVKRIIGKENDKISIQSNIVYRNGIALTENYINTTPYGDFNEVTVPKGKFFVLGDNRANSSDSRFTKLGFVDKSEIVGHVIFRFWPLNNLGMLEDVQQ